MTYPGRPAVTPFDQGDRVIFEPDPWSEVLTVVHSGPYSTTVVTADGVEISYGTYQLAEAPAPAAAIGTPGLAPAPAEAPSLVEAYRRLVELSAGYQSSDSVEAYTVADDLAPIIAYLAQAVPATRPSTPDEQAADDEGAAERAARR
jgi:hypothetical protein